MIAKKFTTRKEKWEYIKKYFPLLAEHLIECKTLGLQIEEPVIYVAHTG